MFSLLELIKLLDDKHNIIVVFKYYHNIISEYKKLNIQTYVILSNDELKVNLKNEKNDSIILRKYLSIFSDVKSDFFYFISFFGKETWSLKKIINLFNPDIIHCNNRITSNLNLIILSRIYKLKCYVHQRQYDYFNPIIFKFIINYPNFIAISKSIHDNLISLGISSSKIQIIPNWISHSNVFKIVKKSSLNKKNFIWIGRIIPWKGLKDVLEILNSFKKLYDCNFHLDVYGDLDEDLDYMQHINYLINSYNLSKHINFMNYIPSKDINFLNYSVFFHSSIKSEPFGRTIIEAMCNNVLVFSSGLGGSGEIVFNKKNGYIFDSNKPNNTSKFLFEILNDSHFYNFLIKNASLDIEKKYSQKVARKLISKLY